MLCGGMVWSTPVENVTAAAAVTISRGESRRWSAMSEGGHTTAIREQASSSSPTAYRLRVLVTFLVGLCA